jgi:hypothetical protein
LPRAHHAFVLLSCLRVTSRWDWIYQTRSQMGPCDIGSIVFILPAQDGNPLYEDANSQSNKQTKSHMT